MTWKLSAPATNSVDPLTAIELTGPKISGAQPPIAAPVASSYALSSLASVATNTRDAECSRQVGDALGGGFGVHGATDPSARTWASSWCSMPATCVNVPPMNQPPAPSVTMAVTPPSRRGRSGVALPEPPTSVQPPVLGPTYPKLPPM